MRSLLPGAAAGAGRQPDALIVALSRLGPGAEGADAPMAGDILLRRDGVETLLQTLDVQHVSSAAATARLETGLRLPAGAILNRDVQLPLAAARDLQTAMNFEMDRLTPFAADEVYWGISAIRTDRAQGRVCLRLSVVLRAPVDALRLSLARAGLSPSFIETGTGRIDIAPGQKRGWGWMRAALPALCGGLFFACLAVPFIRQQIALDSSAREIAALQAKAGTAQALRQQLAAATAGYAAISAARQGGDALQVLATLTNALPDGTWLSNLALKSGNLNFDGQSADAAALIGLLSAVPGVQNPSFTAPVTRTADGKADLFSMHVTVGQ